MEVFILLVKEQFRHFIVIFARDEALYLGRYGITRA